MIRRLVSVTTLAKVILSWNVYQVASLSLSTGRQAMSLSMTTTSENELPMLVCTTAPSLEGTAFCRQVLKRGKFRVRALTRNPDSPRSKALEAMGAELFVADNEDIESLQKAFEGAHGVYGITTWSGATFAKDGSVKRDTSLNSNQLEEAEVRQGQNIIEAAIGGEGEPRVKHFILQSMHRRGIRNTSEYKDPEVEAPLHHKAKWRQEDALVHTMQNRSSQCKANDKTRWSILRQPTYLENFDNDLDAAKNTKLRSLRPGVVGGLLEENVPLTVIAVEDLGGLASRMFEEEHAEKYGNGGVLVAGTERVNGKELRRMAERVCEDDSLNFEYRPIPWFVLNFFIPVEYPRQLKRWLTLGGNDEGYRLPESPYNYVYSGGAKTEKEKDFLLECREIYPEMLTVENWMTKRGVGSMKREPDAFEEVLKAIQQRTTKLVSLLELQ